MNSFLENLDKWRKYTTRTSHSYTSSAFYLIDIKIKQNHSKPLAVLKKQHLSSLS